jgi:hydrogenase-1 operon protein HyaF
MTRVDEIPVQVHTSHGNVRPILFEVLHALDNLLENDTPTTIDLAGLPFGPGELDQLEAALGTGELAAELDALGTSNIRETAYPGVWWIEHRNANNEVTGRYLEVTRLPEILCSQDADIVAGRARLGETFE